ncbi:MAG: 1-acyl-sn-glycerol-3-phosphate acyltransferase, partial [Lachnospiraceae bacterium]|nr:1-acyl-sn-glycerol-3-phosphate acyltransferase [Lachnospiraceae bacterium]
MYKSLPLPALQEYYRERRRKRFENNEPFRGVTIRRILHPVLLNGLKVKHLLCRQKITVIGDKRTTKNSRIIFAATHIGWDDVEMVFTAIKSHAYVLWGDPRESYRTVDGCLLDLNGAFICDTDDKMDRYIAKESCIRWLDRGGNILIFPEGVWNFSENKLVMYLFNGAAEMAVRTGADIVPVAAIQLGREFRVNIGRKIEGRR